MSIGVDCSVVESGLGMTAVWEQSGNGLEYRHLCDNTTNKRIDRRHGHVRECAGHALLQGESQITGRTYSLLRNVNASSCLRKGIKLASRYAIPLVKISKHTESIYEQIWALLVGNEEAGRNTSVRSLCTKCSIEPTNKH